MAECKSKNKDWEDGRQVVIRFKPEGWVDQLVFEVSSPHGCGDTNHGMSIRINDDAGGVLTLDDIAKIRDLMNWHLEMITKTKGVGISYNEEK